MEKKKNSKHYIIPPSYFKAKGIKPIAVTVPNEKKAVASPSETLSQKDTPKVEVPATQTTEEKENVLDIKKDQRTSGLSLKSIRAKKEHQIKQMDVVVDQEDLPKNAFTEEAFKNAWNAYIDQLHKKGEKIMASILEMDTPKLNGTDIKLAFPNDTLKVELERAQYPLMDYLRKRLLNYDLNLDISVNEEISKKYVFTALDKYEKLKEKNPNIELLRKTFGLDV